MVRGALCVTRTGAAGAAGAAGEGAGAAATGAAPVASSECCLDTCCVRRSFCTNTRSQNGQPNVSLPRLSMGCVRAGASAQLDSAAQCLRRAASSAARAALQRGAHLAGAAAAARGAGVEDAALLLGQLLLHGAAGRRHARRPHGPGARTLFDRHEKFLVERTWSRAELSTRGGVQRERWFVQGCERR